MDFTGIVEIGAFIRFGPAFIFIMESKKRDQASAKCIVRLEVQQVTVVEDEKLLRIIAGEIEDGLASGAEAVRTLNGDYFAKKISEIDQGFRWATD